MPRFRRLARLALIASLAAIAVVWSPSSAVQAGETRPDPVGDFDCDGKRDAVKSTPDATVAGKASAGSISVRYSRTGGTQTISQATTGIYGAPEAYDEFGYSYTSYDKNLDGCADLVVSTPQEEIKDQVGFNESAAGMIHIIPGSSTGLKPGNSTAVDQDSAGMPGAVDFGALFGQSLASGVTSSGRPYLLIGVPNEQVGQEWGAGAVIYWRDSTIKMITQDSSGVSGAAEEEDGFGTVLSASDRFFAVGTPAEATGSRTGSGMVHLFSHTLSGGMPKPITGFHQDTSGIAGAAEAGDTFGKDLSIVSYRPTATSPIGALVAVGVPGEAVRNNTVKQAGQAHLVAVTPTGGLTEIADVHQDTPGLTGAPETDAWFGDSVVVAANNLASSTAPATPETAVWAVFAPNVVQPGESYYSGVIHVLDASSTPGDSEVLLVDNTFGLPQDSLFNVWQIAASNRYLYFSTYDSVTYGVPWRNMRNGDVGGVVKYSVDL